MIGWYLVKVNVLQGKNAPTASLNTQKKLKRDRMNMLYLNFLGMLFGELQRNLYHCVKV